MYRQVLYMYIILDPRSWTLPYRDPWTRTNVDVLRLSFHCIAPASGAGLTYPTVSITRGPR